MGRSSKTKTVYSLMLPSIKDCLEECPSPGRKQAAKPGHMFSPRGSDQSPRLRPHKALQTQQASKHQLGQADACLGAGLQNLHKTRTKDSPSSASPRGYSSSSSSSNHTRRPHNAPLTPTNTTATTSKANKGFSSSSSGLSSSISSGSNSSSFELDTAMRSLSIHDTHPVSTPARQHAAAAAAAFVAAAAVAAAGGHSPWGSDPNSNSNFNPKAGVSLQNLSQLQPEEDEQPLQIMTSSSNSPSAFIAAVAAAAAAGAIDLRAVKQLTDGAAFPVAPISPKWPPTISADGACIPAAHNIHLSPCGTGSTTFSSVASLSSPQAAEAAAAAAAAAAATAAAAEAAAAAAAAEAAAERLMSVMPTAAVPESLLTAAGQRVKTLLAIEAVKSCRSHSAPGSNPHSSHLGRGDVTPSAAAAADAAASKDTQSSVQQRDDAGDSTRSKHYRSGSALRPPLHLTPWQVYPNPRSTTGSSSSTSSTPRHTPSQQLLQLHRQPWQQQQQLTLPLQQQQPQQLALERQQLFGSSGGGGYGRRSGHSSRGRAAAPEMTAKAAALFSTVASSVQKDLQMWQEGRRLGQTPRLLRSTLSPAYVSQRTDRWVNEVAKFMVDSGILPKHRVFVYMLRPVHPPPTRWQCVQKKLGKPMHWMETRFGKKARARARALKRVAGH